ncbi:CopD family protein [Paracrocinitomix mangrovi]|uniref:CopD family protein n=1 Tax=Paracrocinitomix mangrovi TaxID=2862509 RepID=UPI001C8D20CE|nr:CopD family protein [Paracrocinitomix mangrovi]UKN00804.1 CopD family protein [Paracrocinitomix mangrovi]
MNTYLLIKSLHLIFVVSWFAGLFYAVRIFVYHAEAGLKDEPEKSILQKQYKLMSKRVWSIIAWPAMILAVGFGTWMLIDNPGLLKLPFMHAKLAFVAGLIVYHFLCFKFHKDQQKNNDKKSGNFYRMWNEVATLFLVAIVFIIIMRSEVDWIYGTVGFVLFGVALMMAVKIYKRAREKSQN